MNVWDATANRSGDAKWWNILTDGDAQESLFNEDYFNSMAACEPWYFEAIEALLKLAALPVCPIFYPATFAPFTWGEIEDKIDTCVIHLLTLRFAHRQNKNYKAGDAIRTRLAGLGIEIEDRNQKGPTVFRPVSGRFQEWTITESAWQYLWQKFHKDKPFPCKTRSQHWLDQLEAKRGEVQAG